MNVQLKDGYKLEFGCGFLRNSLAPVASFNSIGEASVVPSDDRSPLLWVHGLSHPDSVVGSVGVGLPYHKVARPDIVLIQL